MLVLEWKERAFIEKVNSRCFCWFPAPILVHQNGTPIWRLHTKLYKGAWNISANNSETVGHKDLRLGQIVYILVFYNISFSWVLPLDGFHFIFLLRNSENDLFCLQTGILCRLKTKRFLSQVIYFPSQLTGKSSIIYHLLFCPKRLFCFEAFCCHQHSLMWFFYEQFTG